jgi:hypothetical protein
VPFVLVVGSTQSKRHPCQGGLLQVAKVLTRRF